MTKMNYQLYFFGNIGLLVHNEQDIQINTWVFPYWPGYYPETPILARDGVEGQYGSRDDNQANMEMPMY